MQIDEYAVKVQTFVELWREHLITDNELVENITGLGGEVTFTNGGVVVSSRPINCPQD